MPRSTLMAALIVASGSVGVRAGAAEPAPTYHGAVSRILQDRCQACHRPGQVAPFALLSFDQARKRADDIARVVAEKVMPPWHAATDSGVPLRDPRVLSAAEIATLASWAEAGAPEGDPAQAPPAREFPPTGRWASPTSSSSPRPATRSGPTATTSSACSSCRAA